MTETSDATGADRQPRKIDWRRPASPIDGGILVLDRSRALNPAPAPRFQISRVVGRSFAIIRRRWLPISVIAFALGWAPGRIVGLTVHTGYRAGDHHLPTFVAAWSVSLGLTFLGYFANATVVRVAVDSRGDSSVVAAIGSVCGVLSVLVPAWLISTYDDYWRMWAGWNNISHQLRSSVGLINTIWFYQAISWTQMAIQVSALAAIGVFTPVVVVERRSFWGSIARAWRLMAGARWKMVALYLFYGLVLAVLEIPNIAERVAGAHPSTLATVIGWATGLLFEAAAAIWAVVLAATYLELREGREGLPEAQLAEVFA